MVENIGHPATVHLNAPQPPSGSYAQPSAAQVQTANAQFAADGARMYEQAHPGKTYTPGQNGETYPGGINQTAYSQLMAPPPAFTPMASKLAAALQTTQLMVPRLGVSTNEPQGNINPGFTPLQATNSYGNRYQPQSYKPIQGTAPAIQSNYNWN
jgi:hypothetical protein